MMDILFIASIFIFMLLLLFITYIHERKYKKNNPYAKKKVNKTFYFRFLGSLLAGIHYFFVIGAYNHKKYNTQVYTPETLECYIAGSFAGILLLGYALLSYLIKIKYGNLFLLILLIPILTNIISILWKKKFLKIY